MQWFEHLDWRRLTKRLGLAQAILQIKISDTARLTQARKPQILWLFNYNLSLGTKSGPRWNIDNLWELSEKGRSNHALTRRRQQGQRKFSPIIFVMQAGSQSELPGYSPNNVLQPDLLRLRFMAIK